MIYDYHITVIVDASDYIFLLIDILVFQAYEAHTELLAERLNEAVLGLFFLDIHVERTVQVHAPEQSIFRCEVSDIGLSVTIRPHEVHHPLLPLLADKLDDLLYHEAPPDQHLAVNLMLQLIIHIGRGRPLHDEITLLQVREYWSPLCLFVLPLDLLNQGWV